MLHLMFEPQRATVGQRCCRSHFQTHQDRIYLNILDFDIELSEESEQIKFMNKALKKSFAEKMLPFRTVSLNTKHNFYDKNWWQIGIVSTSVLFESAGTRKLFEIA